MMDEETKNMKNQNLENEGVKEEGLTPEDSNAGTVDGVEELTVENVMEDSFIRYSMSEIGRAHV